VSALLTEGQTFAHYVIEAPIGEGGMGAVYRAYDTKLRRKVALKVIHPDLKLPDAAARLVREARAAAALTHPNTIAIHDLGEIDGTVFLVMELISGSPLRAYIGDDAVSVTQKLRWLVDMARGLGAAHRAGLVHRDVKPANVMVSDDGVVKVLDFGLAKPVEAKSLHTDVGLVVGTPRYMAPELFTGVGADARCDQFAFGVTAYELLAGIYPGMPTGPVPAALDTLVPDVGPAVARIIARTLSRSAADRFGSMTEVASELEEHIFTTRLRAPPDASPPTRRDGGAPGSAAALALAPTELPLASARASSGRVPTSERPPRSRATLESVRAPRSRGLAALRTLAVIGVVAAGGYGGFKLLSAGRGPGPDGAAPQASASEAPFGALDDALDAEAEASDPLLVDPALDDALDASDDASDAAADASADDEADAASDPALRRLPLDDFDDPWAKPAAGDPRR
jgi:serine/threonine protein kinase